MSNLALKLVEGTKQERDKFINKTEVLDKIKDIVFLPDNQLDTTGIAEFYEVPKITIRQLHSRHKEEFLNEAKTLNSEGIKEIKAKICSLQCVTDKNENRLKHAKSKITLYNKQGILRVGMLLTNSKVAEKIRNYLIKIEKESTNEQKQIVLKLEDKWSKDHEDAALRIAYENSKKDVGVYQSFSDIAEVLQTTKHRVQNRWYGANNKAEVPLKEIFDNEKLLLERLSSSVTKNQQVEVKHQDSVKMNDLENLFEKLNNFQVESYNKLLNEISSLKEDNIKLTKGMGVLWRSVELVTEQNITTLKSMLEIKTDVDKINKNVELRNDERFNTLEKRVKNLTNRIKQEQKQNDELSRHIANSVIKGEEYDAEKLKFKMDRNGNLEKL